MPGKLAHFEIPADDSDKDTEGNPFPFWQSDESAAAV